MAVNILARSGGGGRGEWGGVSPKNHVHTSSELLYLRPSLILLCCRHFYFDTVFCNSDSFIPLLTCSSSSHHDDDSDTQRQ